MTGSNHFVAGALIATAVAQPTVAIPLALASHFVLDAMPHYGDNNKRSWLNRHFTYVLLTDGFLALLMLSTILILQPTNWILLITCGLVAVAPDIIWLPYYIADLKKQEIKDDGAFARFSKWIQWGERPWGIYLEIVWFVIFAGLLLKTIS